MKMTDDCSMRQGSVQYENLPIARNIQIQRDRLLHEAQLHGNTSEKTTLNQRSPRSANGIEDRIRNIEENIRGNIDALDYLRGISGLERSFTQLVEDVFRVALALSCDYEEDTARVEYVYDPQMDEKVEKCWMYVTQLTEAVHWHVTHAVQHHRFHHALKTSRLLLKQRMEDTEMLINSFEVQNTMEMAKLTDIEKTIADNLIELEQLAARAHELCTQSRQVVPLRYRRNMGMGYHSAQLLTSVRIPDGTRLHRGENVRVCSTSRAASQLHHEWQLRTADDGQEATIPSVCLWLTSPESSPSSSPETDRIQNEKPVSMNKQKRKFRGYDLCNNKALAQRFHMDVNASWEELDKAFARIIFPTYKHHLTNLSNLEGKIAVTNEREMNGFLRNAQVLIEKVDSNEKKLIDQVRQKEIMQTEHKHVLSRTEFNRLSSPLETWIAFHEQLEQVKRFVCCCKTYSAKSPPYLRIINPRKSGPIQTDDVGQVEEMPVEYHGVPTDEFVTSFAEPIPKTFRVRRTESVDHVHPIGLHHHEGMESSDLMTQISTPYMISSVVRCPRCALDYTIDPHETSMGGVSHLTDPLKSVSIQSPSVLSFSSRHIREGDDDLMKKVTRHNDGSTSRGRSRKRLRGLFHFPYRRSQSAATSVTETTTSSGIGSSPDIRENRRKNHHGTKKVQKTPSVARVSFFNWGRSKKRDISEPSNTTEWKSQEINRQVTLSGNDDVNSRSQSCVQHWSPPISGPPRQVENLESLNSKLYQQSGSVSISLKKHKSCSTTDHIQWPYSTIDSCIQTDLGSFISMKHHMKRPKLDVLSCDPGICRQCRRAMDRPPMQDTGLQCVWTMESGITRTADQQAAHCQADMIQKQPNDELWEACCQVGVMRRDQAASPCASCDRASTIKVKYHVACQVGKMTSEIGVASNEYLEAFRLLDQSVDDSTTKVESGVKVKFLGKKVQVGKPWVEEKMEAEKVMAIYKDTMPSKVLEDTSIKSNTVSVLQEQISIQNLQPIHSPIPEDDIRLRQMPKNRLISDSIRNRSQQTDITMIQLDTFAPNRKNDGTQTQISTKFSTSTQIGVVTASKQESPIYDYIIPELLCSPPTKSSPLSIFTTTNEQPERFTCLSCDHRISPEKIDVRSKRIQKGSPAVMLGCPKKENGSTSELEILDDDRSLTEELTAKSRSRKHHTPRSRSHHVVLDIGFYDKQKKYKTGNSRSHTERSYATETNSSSTSSSEKDYLETKCGNVRMYFKLLSNDQVRRRTKAKDDHHIPKSERSWSVDDLQVHEGNTIRTIERGVSKTFMVIPQSHKLIQHR